MMRKILGGAVLPLLVVLLASCASNDILEAFRIDAGPQAEDRSAADRKTIADLKKQLGIAKQREAALNDRIAELEQAIEKRDRELDGRIAEFEAAIEKKQAELGIEMSRLRQEIEERDAVISIQRKVIGLLDDSDQTLQKSIEKQLRNR